MKRILIGKCFVRETHILQHRIFHSIECLLSMWILKRRIQTGITFQVPMYHIVPLTVDNLRMKTDTYASKCICDLICVSAHACVYMCVSLCV